MSVHLLIDLIDLYIYFFINLLIHIFIYLLTYLFIYLFIHLFIYLFIYFFIHLFILSFTYSSPPPPLRILLFPPIITSFIDCSLFLNSSF